MHDSHPRGRGKTIGAGVGVGLSLSRSAVARTLALITAATLLGAGSVLPASATEIEESHDSSRVLSFPPEGQEDEASTLEIPDRSDVDAGTHVVITADGAPLYVSGSGGGSIINAEAEIQGYLSAGDVVRMNLPSHFTNGYASDTPHLDMPGHWIRLEDSAIQSQIGVDRVWINRDWVTAYTEDAVVHHSFESQEFVELPSGEEIPVLQVPEREITETPIEHGRVGVIARDWVPIYGFNRQHPGQGEDPVAYVRRGSVLQLENEDRVAEPGRFAQVKDPLVQEQLGQATVWIAADAFEVIDEDYAAEDYQRDDSGDSGPIFRMVTAEEDSDGDSEPPTLQVPEKPHHNIAEPTEYVTVTADNAPIYDPGLGGSSPPREMEVMAYASQGDVFRFTRGDPEVDGEWISLVDTVLFEQVDARRSQGWISADHVAYYQVPEEEPDDDDAPAASPSASASPSDSPSPSETSSPTPSPQETEAEADEELTEEELAEEPEVSETPEPTEPSTPTPEPTESPEPTADAEPSESAAPSASPSLDPTEVTESSTAPSQSSAAQETPAAAGSGSPSPSPASADDDEIASSGAGGSGTGNASESPTGAAPGDSGGDTPDASGGSGGGNESSDSEGSGNDSEQEGSADPAESDPDTTASDQRGGFLAQTGAQIAGVAAAALGILALGLILLLIRRMKHS